MNCPRLYGQHKNPLRRKYSFLSGVALRQRRNSSFYLDALVVIEMNVAVNQIICFVECLRLVTVDTLCFQDRKEVFCHGIVIGIALT